MLQLNVARLKRSLGDCARYDLKSDLPPLKLEDESVCFSGPVMAGLDVINTGSALEVKGEVSGKLTLTCSRCLEPFEYSFDVPIEETYAPDTEGEHGEAVSFSGDLIDITPEVLKSIILALPMKSLCLEECRGLCPKCGRNLNEGRCDCENEDIDPRFNVLKDLLKEKE